GAACGHREQVGAVALQAAIRLLHVERDRAPGPAELAAEVPVVTVDQGGERGEGADQGTGDVVGVEALGGGVAHCRLPFVLRSWGAAVPPFRRAKGARRLPRPQGGAAPQVTRDCRSKPASRVTAAALLARTSWRLH